LTWDAGSKTFFTAEVAPSAWRYFPTFLIILLMKNIFVAMLLLVGTFCSAANAIKPVVSKLAAPAKTTKTLLTYQCDNLAIIVALETLDPKVSDAEFDEFVRVTSGKLELAGVCK
jgi:hypothetical protein